MDRKARAADVLIEPLERLAYVATNCGRTSPRGCVNLWGAEERHGFRLLALELRGRARALAARSAPKRLSPKPKQRHKAGGGR